MDTEVRFWGRIRKQKKPKNQKNRKKRKIKKTKNPKKDYFVRTRQGGSTQYLYQNDISLVLP